MKGDGVGEMTSGSAGPFAVPARSDWHEIVPDVEPAGSQNQQAIVKQTGSAADEPAERAHRHQAAEGLPGGVPVAVVAKTPTTQRKRSASMDDILSPVCMPAPIDRHQDGTLQEPSHRSSENGTSEARRAEQFFQQALATFEVGQELTVRRGNTPTIPVDENDVKGLPRYMLHPGDKRRLTWDVFCMALLFYSVVNVPLQVAFEDREKSCSSAFLGQNWSFYVDLCVDMAFISDLAINMRTAYWHPKLQQTLVTDQKSIFLNYLKGFLIIDIVGSFPVDLVMLPFCAEKPSGNTNNLLRAPKILKQLRLLRALRLLRVSRFKRMVDRIRDVLNISPGYLRLLQLTFVIFIGLHYDACIFYWIGALHMPDPDLPDEMTWHTWVSRNDNFADQLTYQKNVPVKDLPADQAYLVAFYWACTTVMTVGLGDVTPETTLEALFTIVVMIQGGCALGYVVGSFADMVSRINMRRKRYRELCEQWDFIFHQSNFPPLLRKRIRDFNLYKYSYPTGAIPKFAIVGLSKELLREITRHVHQESLTSLPLFRQLVQADQHCATELALSLSPKQLPPLELIYAEHEVGDTMYFLNRGAIQLSIMMALQTDHDWRQRVQGYVLEVKKSTPGMRILSLVRGDDKIKCRTFNWVLNETTCSHFGESALFSATAKYMSTAVTQTEATLLALSWNCILQICLKYPAAQNLVRVMQRSREPTLARLVRALIQVQRARKNVGARLKIIIHSAQSLPKMDATARCDPFVEIAVDDALYNMELKKTTIVRRNTYAPEWNQAFTFTVKEPDHGRPVSVDFNVMDWDLLSLPDTAGRCSYDVTSMLLQCMEEQREIVVEKKWITLMQEASGWASRIRRDTGALEPVRGVDGKHAQICCTFSCCPPDTCDDHADYHEAQSRSVQAVRLFRQHSSASGTVRPAHAAKRPLQSGSFDNIAQETTCDDGMQRTSLSELEGLIPDGSLPEDAPFLSVVGSRAAKTLDVLTHLSPTDPGIDPASLRQSAIEAWTYVKALADAAQVEAEKSTQEAEQLADQVQRLHVIVAATSPWGSLEHPVTHRDT